MVIHRGENQQLLMIKYYGFSQNSAICDVDRDLSTTYGLKKTNSFMVSGYLSRDMRETKSNTSMLESTLLSSSGLDIRKVSVSFERPTPWEDKGAAD